MNTQLGSWCRALLTAFFLFALSWPAAAQDVRPSDRVVRNVVVRAEPTTRSTAIAALPPGQSAELEAEVPGWYRVRLQNGLSGYVSKSWTVLDQGTPPPPSGAGQFKLHVIDVGTGLALFVEGPDFTLIYDGGSQDDLADEGDNRILAYLKSVKPDLTTIDHLILSHPHKDHLELLPDIFDAFAVRNVWDSGRVNKTQGYCRFLKKVEAEPGVLYHDAIASNGEREVSFSGSRCAGTIRLRQSSQMSDTPIRLGAMATMSILYRDASPHADPNENSVVVRLDLGTKRILLAGDAEGGDRQPPSAAAQSRSVEAKLLACCAAALQADVLVVGHHGSLTSSRAAFLDAVRASTFIISSGPYPYRSVVLPDEMIVDELKRRGAVFRTDIDDAACGENTAKIGPDADESPGGCSNVVVTIDHMSMTTSYRQQAD